MVKLLLLKIRNSESKFKPGYLGSVHTMQGKGNKGSRVYSLVRTCLHWIISPLFLYPYSMYRVNWPLNFKSYTILEVVSINKSLRNMISIRSWMDKVQYYRLLVWSGKENPKTSPINKYSWFTSNSIPHAALFVVENITPSLA